MAEISSTKKEKKVNAPMKNTPSAALKEASDGVSAIEMEQHTDSLLEENIVKAFKEEFKGMPYTELSVIVCCGARNMPTYQEIELPVVAELLLKHRKK